MNFTWRDVSAQRLARHGISPPKEDVAAADVVAAMCGAHAQVMSAAEISVALRLAGATRAAVRVALWQEHSLVKTFGPRATVHLLPTRDLPMWTAALSALPAPDGGVPEEAQLTPQQSEAVVAALAAVLAGAELTVDELDEAMADLAGAWAGDRVVPAWYEMLPRWRPALYTAARRGLLVYGPPRQRKVTYTNPRRWLAGMAEWDGPSALRELLRRYLHAYGPATSQQFAQWLATPRTLTAELFAAMEDELQPVQLEGQKAWLLAGDAVTPRERQTGLHLLPYFDAYVVGCQPRDRLFPGRAAERALAGGQAGNYPVLLLDGVVAGVWHQRRSGRKVQLTVEPLQPLNRRQLTQLQAAAQRIGEILQGVATLSIGTIDVGPHA